MNVKALLHPWKLARFYRRAAETRVMAERLPSDWILRHRRMFHDHQLCWAGRIIVYCWAWWLKEVSNV